MVAPLAPLRRLNLPSLCHPNLQLLEMDQKRDEFFFFGIMDDNVAATFDSSVWAFVDSAFVPYFQGYVTTLFVVVPSEQNEASQVTAVNLRCPDPSCLDPGDPTDTIQAWIQVLSYAVARGGWGIKREKQQLLQWWVCFPLLLWHLLGWSNGSIFGFAESTLSSH